MERKTSSPHKICMPMCLCHNFILCGSASKWSMHSNVMHEYHDDLNSRAPKLPYKTDGLCFDKMSRAACIAVYSVQNRAANGNGYTSTQTRNNKVHHNHVHEYTHGPRCFAAPSICTCVRNMSSGVVKRVATAPVPTPTETFCNIVAGGRFSSVPTTRFLIC